MHLGGWEQKRGWPHILSMPQHCFVAKQLNTTLFCRKTLKYGTFCRETLKLPYFLSRNVKIRAMSRKNGINCAASWLRILCCSAVNITQDSQSEQSPKVGKEVLGQLKILVLGGLVFVEYLLNTIYELFVKRELKKRKFYFYKGLGGCPSQTIFF